MIETLITHEVISVILAKERPAEASDRTSFGNWEIDTVIGQKKGQN